MTRITPFQRNNATIAAPELAVARWFNTSAPLSLSGLRGRVVYLHAFQLLCMGCVAHSIPQVQRIFAQPRQGNTEVEIQPLTLDMPEVEDGATLPARALRHLFEHAAIHLNVEWRNADDATWALYIPDRQAPIAVSELPMLRARSIWMRSLDLDAGGRRTDLPMALGI